MAPMQLDATMAWTRQGPQKKDANGYRQDRISGRKQWHGQDRVVQHVVPENQSMERERRVGNTIVEEFCRVQLRNGPERSRSLYSTGSVAQMKAHPLAIPSIRQSPTRAGLSFGTASAPQQPFLRPTRTIRALACRVHR